jgi:hypothetical protein
MIRSDEGQTTVVAQSGDLPDTVQICETVLRRLRSDTRGNCEVDELAENGSTCTAGTWIVIAPQYYFIWLSS